MARTPGSGSVYQRKDRKGWTAQVVVGTRENGSFIYKRKTYPTKREAVLALPELSKAVNEKPVPTVAYYYKVFSDGRGAKISEDKRRAYKIAYNRLERYHHTPVNELTVAGIQEIINTSCKTFYPAKDLRGLIRHILRRAGADGIPVNLSLPDLLELPALVEEKREPFTEEEQIALWLSYEGGNQPAGVPLVMIYTGLMTGEMRKLTADMIDFDRQEIVGVGLKTDERHEKSVLIPDDIIPILEDMVNRCPEGRFFPMSEEHFYDMYYKALEDAGITRHLTPYSCRTTTATTLAVHREVAPQIVQRVMRWKSTKVMDKYVKPDDTDARRALNKI